MHGDNLNLASTFVTPVKHFHILIFLIFQGKWSKIFKAITIFKAQMITHLILFPWQCHFERYPVSPTIPTSLLKRYATSPRNIICNSQAQTPADIVYFLKVRFTSSVRVSSVYFYSRKWNKERKYYSLNFLSREIAHEQKKAFLLVTVLLKGVRHNCIFSRSHFTTVVAYYFTLYTRHVIIIKQPVN